MTQEVISPVDQKVRERIRGLKYQVKEDARILRLLKLCRKTKKKDPRWSQIMSAYGLGRSSPQYAIWRRKHQATANLIAYGRLRGKEHTVKEPDRWAYEVEAILKD